MRGNQISGNPMKEDPRSIPAYAGEPGRALSAGQATGVYPRVCGGTVPGLCPGVGERGLSPRMRGNPTTFAPPARGKRSIPAYAGEPLAVETLSIPSGVYPRVCGGTGQPAFGPACYGGLSPRMRGNLSLAWAWYSPVGSIPAYAGEPTGQRKTHSPPRVYPRVCGGTGRQ